MMGHAKVRIALLTLVAGGGVALALAACGSSPAPQSEDAKVDSAIEAACTATTPPSCTSTPNYADAVPILQKSCVPCHAGSAGAPQWPLTKYIDIEPWAGDIQGKLCAGAMPPADGGIALAPSDRLTLLDWVQCGAPE
jgi:hypothetical protein